MIGIVFVLKAGVMECWSGGALKFPNGNVMLGRLLNRSVSQADIFRSSGR
jgi:hypothetical protein